MKKRKEKRGRPVDTSGLILAREYYKKGLSVPTIAKKINRHPKQVYRWLSY